eukprot:scaffold12758_cov20-Tisochrysis_lutea.AAC.1
MSVQEIGMQGTWVADEQGDETRQFRQLWRCASQVRNKQAEVHVKQCTKARLRLRPLRLRPLRLAKLRLAVCDSVECLNTLYSF